MKLGWIGAWLGCVEEVEVNEVKGPNPKLPVSDCLEVEVLEAEVEGIADPKADVRAEVWETGSGMGWAGGNRLEVVVVVDLFEKNPPVNCFDPDPDPVPVPDPDSRKPKPLDEVAPVAEPKREEVGRAELVLVEEDGAAGSRLKDSA